MQFLSIEAFIPSGKDFNKARDFFVELGFTVNWEQAGYAGLQRENCRFILQAYDNFEFASNLMLSVKVDKLEEFRQQVLEKQLPEKYGVRLGEIIPQPYGREVNLIDMAGVCWHFVE